MTNLTFYWVLLGTYVVTALLTIWTRWGALWLAPLATVLAIFVGMGPSVLLLDDIWQMAILSVLVAFVGSIPVGWMLYIQNQDVQDYRHKRQQEAESFLRKLGI